MAWSFRHFEYMRRATEYEISLVIRKIQGGHSKPTMLNVAIVKPLHVHRPPKGAQGRTPDPACLPVEYKYCEYIGRMEKKMETTIVYWGIYWGNIWVILG